MRTCTLLSASAIICAIAAPLSADDKKLFAVTPEQAAAYIEAEFGKTGNSLAANAIGSARENLSLTKYTLYKYRQHVPTDQKNKYDSRIIDLKNLISKKVDSLVNENLAIVKQSGSAAGYEFRRYLAVQAGLFETDLLPVDNALSEYAGNKNGKTSSKDSPRQEQSPETTASAPASPPVSSPGMEQAGDENERERATALSTAAKIRRLLAVENIEEAAIVFRIHEQFLQKFSDKDSFTALKESVDAASSQRQKAQAGAAVQARNIERLLDREKVTEAFTALQNDRESLKKNLDPDAMRLLEKKVGQAYTAFLRMQAHANRTMREIRDLLAAENIENAYSLFEMSRTELERSLYPDAFRILQEEVTKAYGLVQNKKNLSYKIRRDVQSLCKAGKLSNAADLFAGNQNLLQQNLQPREYAALQAEVERAKRDLRTQQSQAASTAASIESFLAARRVQAAFSLFDEKKELLRKYLTDQTLYIGLKERVLNAYDDLREAQSKALQTSNKINALCDRREGKKALALFKQESAHLRKYSAPGVYARLESSATLANAVYETNRNTARDACSRINGLLSQNQTVRAHAEYLKAEDDISFYLAGDPEAENLQKREAGAWDRWQERNRWATSTVRQIRGLISARRGNAAWSLLQTSRADLLKYVDAQALSKLDTDAARANSAYDREKAQAERNAAAVLSLLDQKRIEAAAAAFDTLESDLRFYCAPAAFENLKTRVEASNSLLQGKKGESRKVLAAINNQIAGERGDSADAIFTKNSDLLLKYSPAHVYKKTEERVAQARRAYEKNVREAGQLSSRLQTMARNSLEVEAAYDQFRYEHDHLAHYLDKNSFSVLEQALQVPYNAFMERRKESRTIVQALRRMIKDEQYTIAKSQFGRSDKQLARYLPADEYMEILTKVTTAYNNSVRGRASANVSSRKIRAFLNEGQSAKAWAAFKESRETLERYLPEAEFTWLHAEVTSAQEEQEKKSNQAREFAKAIKQRIAKGQTWEAYRDFKLNRAELSEYLDAQTYADLETTVMNAYEQARGMAKK